MTSSWRKINLDRATAGPDRICRKEGCGERACLSAGRKRPRCAGDKRKRIETACVSWQGGVNTKEKRTEELKCHCGLPGNMEQGFAQPSPEVFLAAAESRGQSEGSLWLSFCFDL